jgi:hypothetical protein
LADTLLDDPHFRALRDAILATHDVEEAAHLRLTADLREQLAAAERDMAAKRRDRDRRLRSLEAAVAPARPTAPSGDGWVPEPPRANGTASKRKLAQGAGLQDVGGLRGAALGATMAVGEQGLTPQELVQRILAEADGQVRERFERLADKVKNASDALYFARENQAALGVRVERNGPRWRILREAGE